MILFQLHVFPFKVQMDQVAKWSVKVSVHAHDRQREGVAQDFAREWDLETWEIEN